MLHAVLQLAKDKTDPFLLTSEKVPTDPLFRYLEQQGVHITKTIVNPQDSLTNWAQIWVATENQVELCMSLRQILAENHV